MRQTFIYKPGDIRVENVPDPKIISPTDAIIRIAATCVCGSDLWDYRGINPVEEPHPIGHEYVGVVEEVGDEVSSVTPGQFVVGSFSASDNTCPICESGYQTSCLHREFINGCQAEGARIPLADVACVKELTGGIGADSVLECVGMPESMQQAMRSTRPGGNVGFVGVPHGVEINGEELFYSHAGLRGGPAPVRAFLPGLIDRVLDGRINPGQVFDLTLPLDQVAEGYRAMDERRAIKALLRP